MLIQIIVFNNEIKLDPIEREAGIITVGRRHTGVPDPDLNFEWDMEVSRKHCAVRIAEGNLYIRDSGSRNGTYVGGVRLDSGAELELPFGEPVKTGVTVWAAIPADWIVFRHDHVTVFGRSPRFLYYPLINCRLTDDFEFYAIKTNGECPEDFSIKLDIPELSYTAAYSLRLKESEKTKLDFAGFERDYNSIKGLKKTVKTALRFEIACGDIREWFQRELVVFGLWDFPFDESCWKAAAVYVSPFSDDIRRIVQSAETRFCAQTGLTSFDALMRSDEADAERRIFKTLYEFLRGDNRWIYEEPETGHIGGISFQRIRQICHKTADDIPGGAANCFDLSLAMASCLEKAGLCPLVILLGHDRDRPIHAVAGCWIGTVPGSRPVIGEAGFILDELDEGNIFIAESTGMIGGKTALSFDDAVKAGRAQLQRAQWVRAIDIAALHPPYGTVDPVDLLYTGEYGDILNSCEAFAKRKQSKNIEMTHLLYGLMTESGIFRTLLPDAGVVQQEACEKLDRLVTAGTYDGSPAATVNYFGCIHLANHLAYLRGSSFTGEQDLVWSFLIKRHDSVKVWEACQSCGIDLNDMEKAMKNRYGKPDVNLSVSGP